MMCRAVYMWLAWLTVAAAGLSVEQQDSSAQPPAFPVWPEKFHSRNVQRRGEDLGIVDLYYDWPRGGNLNLIR
jgi:hypothetical protein